MKIILRNSTGEFVDGCQYTVIEADKALVALVARRAVMALGAGKKDDQFDEMRFWDYSPTCITADRTGWPEKTLDRIERVTDQYGHMLLPKRLGIPDEACDRIDLCRMVVECHGSDDRPPCLYWEFNLKGTNEVISTHRIELDELEEFCDKADEVRAESREARIEEIVESLLEGRGKEE